MSLKVRPREDIAAGGHKVFVKSQASVDHRHRSARTLFKSTNDHKRLSEVRQTFLRPS